MNERMNKKIVKRMHCFIIHNTFRFHKTNQNMWEPLWIESSSFIAQEICDEWQFIHGFIDCVVQDGTSAYIVTVVIIVLFCNFVLQVLQTIVFYNILPTDRITEFVAKTPIKLGVGAKVAEKKRNEWWCLYIDTQFRILWNHKNFSSFITSKSVDVMSLCYCECWYIT